MLKKKIFFAAAFALSGLICNDCYAEKPKKELAALLKEHEAWVNKILGSLDDLSKSPNKSESANEFVKQNFNCMEISRSLCKKRNEEISDLFSEILAKLYSSDSILQMLAGYKIVEKSLTVEEKKNVEVLHFRMSNGSKEVQVIITKKKEKIIEVIVDKISTVSPIVKQTRDAVSKKLGKNFREINQKELVQAVKEVLQEQLGEKKGKE